MSQMSQLSAKLIYNFPRMEMTMTRLTQIMTVITSLAIITGFTTVPNVSAHSEGSPLTWFSSGTQSLCYSSSGLGAMKFDGSTPNTAAVKTQIKLGQSQMSVNTDMNLSETTSCTGYKSWVTSYYDPSTANLSKTSILFTSGGVQYKTMEYNNNQYLYWVTNGNCSPLTMDLSNVANHEFGHFSGMYHQTGGSSHTMMSSSCDSGYSSIKAADIAFVNDHYL